MPISAGSGYRAMVTCVPSRSARRERRRASACPGASRGGAAARGGVERGREGGAAVKEIDQPGGRGLEVGCATQVVDLGECRKVGRVAWLGAGIELDHQGALFIREEAQAVQNPGDELVGVGGGAFPDRAVGDV